MLKNSHINIEAVKKLILALEEINEQVVYVGGAIVSIYATDQAAIEPRPTKDIDVTVEVSSYSEMDKLRLQLQKKKIHPSPEGNILYRYKYEDIKIDFIPYDPTPLGPANSWLKPGFEKAVESSIGGHKIKVLPVPYFLATKWEAFQSRGEDDPIYSHDFEDIIYVLDNNLELIEQVTNTDQKVITFLKKNELLYS